MRAKRLKKQSAANSASPKQPEKPTFFVDRQLGRYKFAGILRAAGLDVVIHDDHFAPDTIDTEWLAVAGERGWIVITRDERIRYRTAEREAVRRAKVRAFVLVAHGDLSAEALAEIFLKALTKVQTILTRKKPPFIAKIWRGGQTAVIDF